MEVFIEMVTRHANLGISTVTCYFRLYGQLALAIFLCVVMQAAPAEYGAAHPLSMHMDEQAIACSPFLGFGFHGDFFLTRSCNAERGVAERDLELIFRRVEEMRPKLIRTFFNYKWWEPEEGKQTPDSEEMRDYVKWCRFLQSIGASVLLTPWGENFAYSEWMLPSKGFEERFQGGGEKEVSISSWSMAPKLPIPEKRDATVRSLVDLVKYLRVDEGLDNVRYLCFMNEPDNDAQRPVPAEEYMRLTRLLDTELRAQGLREGVMLLGPDDSGGPLDSVDPWFEATISLDKELFDATSSHTYVHKPEDLPKLPGFIQSRQAVLDKLQIQRPLMITEFGYGGSTFQNLENHKYEYGLYLPDFGITAVEAGATAALAWCMFDTYYDRESRDTEHKQEYGMWRWLDEGWKPRPGFYSWSLLTRYTQPGSNVYKVAIEPANDSIKAVLFVTPEGRVTLPMVNRSEQPFAVNLTSGLTHPVALRLYPFTPETIPTGTDEMLGAREVIVVNPGQTTTLELPGRSFFLLTDMT